MLKILSNYSNNTDAKEPLPLIAIENTASASSATVVRAEADRAPAVLPSSFELSRVENIRSSLPTGANFHGPVNFYFHFN